MVFENLKWDEEGDVPDDNKKIEEVILKLENEFSPAKNITYERFVFNTCSQSPGQSFEDYLTELKRLSSSCEFGTLKDSFIVDRIVVGIQNDAVRERLLRMKIRDLSKVVELCKSAELVTTQMAALKPSENSVDNVSIAVNQAQRVVAKCKFCGKSHKYGKEFCPAAEKACDNCAIQSTQ